MLLQEEAGGLEQEVSRLQRLLDSQQSTFEAALADAR